MQRRGFVAQVLAGGVLWGSGADGTAQQTAAPGKLPGFARLPGVVIERPLIGQPRSGKVLAAIQPHADDILHFHIKHFFVDYDLRHVRGVLSDREVGRPYGLEWAEAFHYIGPAESMLDRYIADHAVPLSGG